MSLLLCRRLPVRCSLALNLCVSWLGLGCTARLVGTGLLTLCEFAFTRPRMFAVVLTVTSYLPYTRAVISTVKRQLGVAMGWSVGVSHNIDNDRAKLRALREDLERITNELTALAKSLEEK
eukprot:m.377403 g.377403  ORF g.377403 m.377403 type:complete len:121 (-) comp16705_c4_seq27:2386-2748(-)